MLSVSIWRLVLNYRFWCVSREQRVCRKIDEAEAIGVSMRTSSIQFARDFVHAGSVARSQRAAMCGGIAGRIKRNDRQSRLIFLCKFASPILFSIQ